MTGPDGLRAWFSRHIPADLVAGPAALRPWPGEVIGYATRTALRELTWKTTYYQQQCR
jgi:hypothetical protein